MIKSNCPFCGIADKEPERVIEEKKRVVIFLADPRRMKGHTLIVPKSHVERISELKSEERQELVETALIEFPERILNEGVAPGYDIRRHYRHFEGENANVVKHLHVHVLPRWNEDNWYRKVGVNKNKVRKKLSEEERKELKEKLGG